MNLGREPRNFFVLRRQTASIACPPKSSPTYSPRGPCQNKQASPHGAALTEIGAGERQETGRTLDIRAENSHLAHRRRERAVLRFRQVRSLQKFAVQATVTDHLNQEAASQADPSLGPIAPLLLASGAVFVATKDGRRRHWPPCGAKSDVNSGRGPPRPWRPLW